MELILKGILYPVQKDTPETDFQNLILAHPVSNTGLGLQGQSHCFIRADLGDVKGSVPAHTVTQVTVILLLEGL